MNWQPTGYQSERYVDDQGMIVGEVEYRPGRNEIDAWLRTIPIRALGSFINVASAQKAVERGLEELK